MGEKFSGCLAVIVIAVVVIALGAGALVSGIGQMFGSYWQGKGNYELASAAANAVRADTQAAHGLDARTLALVILPVGVSILFAVIFLSYSAWREARLMRMLELAGQTYIATDIQTVRPARPPKPTYALLEAPERENIYIPVWAGTEAGQK